MILLQTRHLAKSFDTNEVLKDINIEIKDNERIGLIGRNGSGKTTLFRILSGELEATGGEIFRSKDLNLLYLEQVVSAAFTGTVYDYVLESFQDILSLRGALEVTFQALASEPENPELLENYAELQHRYEEVNGFALESKVRGILSGLGFQESDNLRLVSSLSGGELTKLELAKVLSRPADLLLLDEPTNHLDIKATQWLEEFLKNYRGSVLLITHDRVFLDRVTDKIIEIEAAGSTTYYGNYSYYTEEKRKRYEIALKEYEANQRLIRSEEDKLRVFKERSHKNKTFARRAEDRAKKLSRIERLDKPLWLDRSMHLRFQITNPSGNEVLTVKGLSKSFGENELFSDLSFKVFRKQRFGIVGPNGIGKTTLLKILLGEEAPDKGQFRWGANTQVSYYDQSHQDLTESNTVLNELHSMLPTETETQIRNQLGSFLFRGDEVFQPVSTLSGGERARLSLLKMMLEDRNVLVLDEPTNHLDLASKETLEKSLKEYPGTLIFVSHDRYFLNQIATDLLVLEADRMLLVEGNYQDYEEGRGIQIKAEATQEVKKPSPKRKKLSERLDLNSIKIKLQEELLREIDLAFTDPTVYNNTEEQAALEARRAEREAELQKLKSLS